MSVQQQDASRAGSPEVAEHDEFAKLLKEKFKSSKDDPRLGLDLHESFEALATVALDNSNLVRGHVLDSIDRFIDQIDEMLSGQINEVIHAPEFQQLESAWRGLDYLVRNSATDSTLKIRVLNVGKDELYRSLKDNSDARWDQGPLFKAIYESEFGQYGGQPYGALVADYYFSHSRKDVLLLRELSKICASAMAPLITGADPALLRMESWTELMNPRDLGKVMDTPEYGSWRSLRESEDSRFVSLCLPRVLARAPYGAKSEPVDEFAFEEDTDGHTGKKYGWMNAAYAMAANVNRAFKEWGWTVHIRGVESGGTVDNLPTHTFESDDGDVDEKCPTEIAITDRRDAELAKLGLMALVHRKNSDQATFMLAQTLYRPHGFDNNPDATASDELSARLPYMFAVSRFSHYLKCMVRDKIGSTKEKVQLENWLNNWLTQYVDGDPKHSTETVKATKPLAGAKILIIPDEEKPGYYRASIFLRPHYQLESMDVGMSLVATLAEGKS